MLRGKGHWDRNWKGAFTLWMYIKKKKKLQCIKICQVLKNSQAADVDPTVPQNSSSV